MPIWINPHLFAAYWGLFSCGYDLMESGDPAIQRICDRLGQVEIPLFCTSYFSLAKTGGEGVNPYYPRGSDLSVACFFQEKTMADYIAFLTFCGSPSLRDPDFPSWIAALPAALRAIENSEAFQPLFQEYRREAEVRFSPVGTVMDELTRVLTEAGLYRDIALCFAPNLLQSPYLVDYALVDGTLYIIGAVCSKTAVLHEYLHLLLHDSGDRFFRVLENTDITRFAAPGLLRKLGYLPDDSPASQTHALEDCFIRALSGILAGEDPDGGYALAQLNLGFTAVPDIMARLKGSGMGEQGLDRLIDLGLGMK